jgi:cardiolipin synthase
MANQILPILSKTWEFIQNWYWIPVLIFYLSTITTILIENRNPSKTIAWILIIFFLPVFGLILYFFFGQKFNRKKMFGRLDDDQRKRIQSKWEEFKEINNANFYQIEEKLGNQSKVFRYLNNSKASPTYTHNEVELLLNGEEKFPKFLEALRKAQHHIHLEYYIFDLDQIGMEVIDILKTKSNEGVNVRVMIDNFGSPKFSRNFAKILEGSKVELQVFLPVQFSSLANSNYRNHRKILIVDGEVAFVGGINISDKYINSLPYSKNNQVYWRDTSVQIKGNAVDMLQIYFWLNWMTTSGKIYDVSLPGYLHQYENHVGADVKNITGFGFSIPAGDVPTAMESMILAISLAKKKVQICTPYFIPSDEFKSALLVAVSSGVEVELMLPKIGDSFIVQQASLSFLKPLMKRGVKVLLYEKGFIHAKTLVIDDDLAFVGTVNLDNRSFFINFEITAIMHDEELIRRMKTQFEEDLNVSEELTYEIWDNQPIYKRAIASICRLLAPIL